MELHFLGTGGYHPNERRHTACLMLPELGVVFDVGTAAFRIPPRLQTSELTVFLSHGHLDHICGLTYLLVPMIDGRLSEVRVWATPEVITAVQQHLFAETIFPKLPENLVFRDITQVESVPVGNNLQVAHRVLVSHPGQSRGYRLEYGGPRPQPLLAYVTDTTVDGTYDDFVDQVPCLIHECYFGAANAHWAHATGHSTSHMVGELGARCHAQRLILVHADPLETLPEQELLSECRSRYPTAELAWDGKVLCLNNLL